uniref:Uncharacterized protein n=1 Tax=viral metagenome TaxID=1070528 RepID=A0A6C0B9P8_9ZZZZ
MTDAFKGAVVGILLFLFVCVLWTKYAKGRVEGFASGKTPTDIVQQIKTTNNDLADTLNKIKYRSSYEDIIVESETWATDTQLHLLSSGKIGVGTIDECIKSVRQFNDLKTFKTNLTDLMNTLDAI